MALLTIDDEFPEFSLTALKGGNLHDINAEVPEDYFETIDSNSFKGKWRVIFFYPKDFTFVCPTEIKAFGDLNDEFFDRDCQILGAPSSPTSSGVPPTTSSSKSPSRCSPTSSTNSFRLPV